MNVVTVFRLLINTNQRKANERCTTHGSGDCRSVANSRKVKQAGEAIIWWVPKEQPTCMALCVYASERARFRLSSMSHVTLSTQGKHTFVLPFPQADARASSSSSSGPKT